MKRLSVLLIAMLTAGCLLTGCGGSNDADKNQNNDQNVSQDNDQNADNTDNQNADDQNTGSDEETEDVFAFVYNGTEIKLHAEMAPIVAALGEADNYFESESCAFQGLDKVYTYGSVVINTYPEEKVDYVFTIELKDDTVETKEGIYIGSSKDDVIAAYGTPTSETDTAYIYVKGQSQLNIIFENDAVLNIIYTAITD